MKLRETCKSARVWTRPLSVESKQNIQFFKLYILRGVDLLTYTKTTYTKKELNTVEDIFCSFIIFVFIVSCVHKHLGTE